MRAFLAAGVLALSGCATSHLSSMPASGEAPAIRVIAFAPGDGLMSDAVGVELSNMGYVVIDSGATTAMVARLNLNEVQAVMPEGLAKIHEQGIDAILSVKAVGGPDGRPQSASARMTSTETGRVLAGVTWQNGWGGAPGSIADRVQRDDLTGAAAQIAKALAERIHRR